MCFLYKVVSNDSQKVETTMTTECCKEQGGVVNKWLCETMCAIGIPLNIGGLPHPVSLPPGVHMVGVDS